MPARFNHLRYLFPKVSRGAYHALMIDLRNSLGFEQSDIARFRLIVLDHLYQYGWKAASDAYKVKRSTLFDWKRRFEQSGKKLSSLVPRSTRPHQRRQLKTDMRLNALIRSIREEHGNLGKVKLKPFIDAYASSLGIGSYGIAKINKVIVRNHYYFDRPRSKKRKKTGITRIKRTPTQTLPGYIQMDCITLWVLGKKVCFITAIDVFTRFAWCKKVPSLTSYQARLAFEEFTSQYPHLVREVQTDNGSEFLGEFDSYLEEMDIPHHFIYPRSPKINGTIERFNRTIQDEFLSRSDELYSHQWDRFQVKLTGYLTWYNTQRPHHSLKLKTPLHTLQIFLT